MLIRFLLLKPAMEDLLVVSMCSSISKKCYAVGKTTPKVLSFVCFVALHNKIQTS